MLDAAENGARRPQQDEVAQFIENFALNLAGLGFPRMAARVFVAVLASATGTRTAAELAETLQISPAAVSQAVRYLSQLGLVVRERAPGERRDHYRLSHGMWYEMFARRDSVFIKLEKDLESGIAALGPESPAARHLDETRRFFAFIRTEIPLLVDRWRALNSPAAGQEQPG
ncbi:GbsR/MarR family transcriptional regulator [Micromonospora sp. NPDC048898]|uniref:GbsR/MarR family transcriptional regulator n=1 Tax=Micromonospora sp. NPDC048898 TaxID=3364260 RepID=UPI0037168F4E